MSAVVAPTSRPAKLKRGRASLIGGFATGLCVLALWLGVEYDLGAQSAGLTVLGVLVSALIAAWVRVADL